MLLINKQNSAFILIGCKYEMISIFNQPLRLGRIWHKVNF